MQVHHQGVGSHDLTVHLSVSLWHLDARTEKMRKCRNERNEHLDIKVRTSACIEPLNHPLRKFQPAKMKVLRKLVIETNQD